MEIQQKETKTFCGDSYGNLDLEASTEKEDRTTTKISDSETSPIHNQEQRENVQENLPPVLTSNTSTNVVFEEDNSEIGNLDATNKNNDNQKSEVQRESGETGLKTAEMEDYTNAKGIHGEEMNTVPHNVNRNVNPEEPTHEKQPDESVSEGDVKIVNEDFKTDHVDDKKSETGGNGGNNETIGQFLPENEVSKTPRERLSVHITKAHEESDADDEDDNESDSDSGADSDNNGDYDEDADTGGLFIGRAMMDSARSLTRPQSTSTFREVPGGLRAKANTPASLVTNPTELESLTNLNVQDVTRGTSREAREEVFKRAMTLMSNRCTSARGQDGELFSDRELPFGIHIPHYFYVHQSKPQPMPPLKVWRGYKGNVYFEPITIQSAMTKTGMPSHPLERRQSQQDRRSKSAVTSSTRVPTRATTAGQSTRSYRLVASSPQVYIMDKRAVLNNVTDSVQSDLKYIEEMESTGSLAVRPYSSGGPIQPQTSTKDSRMLYRREKICRGSNVHPIHNNRNNTQSAKSVSNVRNPSVGGQRQSNRKQFCFSAGPSRKSKYMEHMSQNLVVSGDRFAPPTVMSPLLRTTTQFSLSNQRAAVNTPDLLGAYDKLPPLEQVRVSIQHISANTEEDNSRTSPYSSPRYTEEIKPFIKYSPNVKTNCEGIDMRFC